MSKLKQQSSLLKTAWIIACVTVLSKLIGFFRDVVIANFYGAGMVSDSYFYAYQIPSLALILLGGVGGPFHSACVSVFSKIIPSLNEKANERVNKLFNTFLTASFLTFTVLAVLVFVFSDVIMQVVINNASPELISLASNHLKIMSPILVIGGIVGIYYGVLISYREFLIPNISPMIMSFVIICVISLIRQDDTGTMLAVATTVGAICQFVFQLPSLKRLGFNLKPNLDFFHNKDFHGILELLFPAILSSTIGQVYIYIDMFFTSQLPQGAWSSIGYANRIFQFPTGILVTAFLVPLFPIFSKLVADNKFDDIRRYFNKGVGLLNFIAIPIFIAILLLATDCVKILFERGAFDSNATFMVSEALCFLSLALLPYIFRDSLTRVFYAFNDSRTPFLVALSSVAIKIVLNIIFVPKLGIGAITLSTSLVTLVNASLLALLIQRKIKMDYKSFFAMFSKMALAGLLTYVACYGFYAAIGSIFVVDNFVLLLVKTAVMLVLICVMYVIFSYIFKVQYLFELYGRLKNRFIK